MDENEFIFKIEDFDATPKLFWSTDAGVNLFYQKNNNKIFTEINLKQSLTKTTIPISSKLNFQPHVLALRIGLIRGF